MAQSKYRGEVLILSTHAQNNHLRLLFIQNYIFMLEHTLTSSVMVDKITIDYLVVLSAGCQICVWIVMESKTTQILCYPDEY